MASPHTLFLVYTENNDDLIPSNTDKFLDGTDTTPRKFGQQDHSLGVVIFELRKKDYLK